MKKSVVLLILLVSLCSFTLFTKDHFTELVNEKLNEYNTINTPEKIYIHTDKPYYSLDEDLWFTCYLVNGITHEKSSKSWVIHTELIDANDSIVSRKKLFTNNISVAGDFKIEDSWKPGKYLLRAYTNYMRNNAPDYFFNKEINILDIDNKKETGLDNLKNNDKKQENDFKQIKPDLQFYPEGGDLVENIKSKVAVKIKDIGINGKEISGVIVDESDNFITSFTTTHFGLGIFVIVPKRNVKYYAKLELNGVEYKYSLPKTLPKGHTLEVVNSKDYLTIGVSSNEDTGLINTYLVIHQRGQLIYSKYETTNTKGFPLKIPTRELRNGVTHITLFNATGNPVCERLVFVDNKERKGTIEIKKENNVLEPRKEQKLNISSKDSEGNFLPSHLSMSVTNLSAFPYNKYSTNVKTYLLLNSDLRGEIKNPGYFFDEKNSLSTHLLDLTMLTHGWRRFTWKDLLFKNRETTIEPEKGIFISGKTKQLKSPYRTVSCPTRLTFMGKNVAQEPIKNSNKQGRFSFGPFIFFDSIPTLIESRLTNFKSQKDGDRNVLILIDLDQNDSPKIDRKAILKDNTKHTQLENYLKVSRYLKQLNFEYDKKRERLEEVTIIAKKEDKAAKRLKEMSDLTDYGYATNRIDLESDFLYSGQTIFDILNTVPGVNTDPLGNSISIRGTNGTPRILLDKFEVDIEFLSSIQADQVAFIDVLKGADAAFFSNAGNGVIAIYSKTGGGISGNIKRKPGIIDFTAQGFYTARQFYTQDDFDGIGQTVKVDTRTTLHWEPRIVINSLQGEDVTFITSDIKSDYLVIIEGISTSGVPLYATTTFTVE